MKYRKKSVVIEAFQMTTERLMDRSDWPEWLINAWNKEPSEGAVWINPDDPFGRLVCGALGGVVEIDWGDWIIKGVEGEIYSCKPDIFAKTYKKSNALGGKTNVRSQ